MLGDGYHRGLLPWHTGFETKDAETLVESLQKHPPKPDTYGLLDAKDNIMDGVERIFLHKSKNIMLNDDEEEDEDDIDKYLDSIE